ncbi:MAG: MATE family efflux transporter [Lachnospiraceae bacterium]|nr:MATE family efflux transporter [Lachnospiraceae bacterium]
MNHTEQKTLLFSNTDLRKLILPLVLEQALAITVGMADTMMISSVGEAAVSGVSLVDMLNVLIFSVFSAFATGGAVVSSQNLGAQKAEEARRSAKQLLAAVTLTSTIAMLLIILFRHGFVRLFFGSIEADVMEAALLYLVITAISYPFIGVYNSCAALFRSMGKSGITFRVSVIGNIINVAGNAICIFGLKMGVAGVAVPTLVSRIVMAVILLVKLYDPVHEIYLDREKYRPDFKIIKKILYIGIPSGIENGIFQLGRVMVVSIISGFGTVQIAANGVANSLDGMGCIIGQAMNLAVITVIGRCVGANDEKQIRHYTRKMMLITYTATAVFNTILLLNLRPILSLYGLGAETTQLAWILVMIHNGLGIFLWPMAFTLPNVLRACNDVRYPMAVSIFSMFVFRIGFSILLGIHMGMGAIGVWIAMIVDWIFRIICFVWRYLHGDWKKAMHKLR